MTDNNTCKLNMVPNFPLFGYIKCKFTRLHPDARRPEYATDGSGGFDIFAICENDRALSDSLEVRTGVAVEIPEGHVMLIFSRSGHAFKNDVRLANCVAMIDSDYRGEIIIKLRKDSIDTNTLKIKTGDRIAQGLILPFPVVIFEEVENLSETERGNGGFGSTGT